MEITKYNHNDNSEAGLVRTALTQSTKVRTADDNEIIVAVSRAIESAIVYLGLNTTQSDRNAIKLMVISDVKRHFIELTLKEIETAINNGVHGDYGAVRGLAPKDVYAWINSYMQSELRKAELKKLEKQQNANDEPDEEYKRKLRWYNMIMAWNAYKTNGFVNDYGNAVYETLKRHDIIKYNDERVSDFYRLAEANLKQQFNPNNQVGNFVKAKEFKAICEQIDTEKDKNARVQAEAKKLMLNHFFSGLLEMETEVTELFD